jgi:NarL family two-component system response regulator LiaR
MAIAIQAISSHPLLTRAVKEVLAEVEGCPVLPSVSNEAEANQTDVPRLFLLDACSLHTDLRPLVERCRSRSPGSKFLALVAPREGNYADEIRLLCWGIEGFMELSETWRTELPHAIRYILNGQYWVPSAALTAFAKHVQALEQSRLLPGHLLTAREGQILRLLVQHLTNKEISKFLLISERTVKFHVSHILAKLGIESRRDLSPEMTARIQTNGYGETAGCCDFPDGTLSSSNSRTRLRR